MVNDVQQRLAAFLHGANQFEGANGKLVQTDILLLLNTAQRGDVAYLRVQRVFQVLQNGTSGNDTTLQVVNAKALQRLYIEVLEELLVGRLLGEHPVVHLVGTQTDAEIALEVVALFTIVEHLLRLERAHELLHIVVGALAHQEFACRDIEEADATGCLSEVDGTEEVVLFVVQHVVAQRHTRRHQFGDASLDEFLRQFGVFQLVADSHALACSDELWQIGIQGMVGKSRHFVAFVVAIIAVRQRDTQYLRGYDGIVAVGFVEVATTKQQQGLWVLRLEVEELLHHGCQLFAVFPCH